MAVIKRFLAFSLVLGGVVGLLLIGGIVLNGTVSAFSSGNSDKNKDPGLANADRLFVEGRDVFRFETFGDQAVWGGVLGLHKAIEGSALGGVGPGVSPKQALALGLKVDASALPPNLVQAIKHGKVDLDDPAVTVQLLRLNAVVGVQGFFNGDQLASVGITCAACHSTVDDSFAPGIGNRLDGWPNQDLNVGAIVASAPNLQPLADALHTDVATVKKVLLSWGPGKFDAELNLDGKAFRPDGGSAATRIPSAFGKAGQNLHTWEGGWGTVTYWNAFVANLEMHGLGNFFDPRLDNSAKFPLAAAAGFGHTHPYVGEGVLPVPSQDTGLPDQVTAKLGALHAYQIDLPVPTPPAGSFDPAAAARGAQVFNGKGKCSSCHMGSLGTEPGYNAHTPKEICIDSFQADRGPDGTYVTAPLQALFTRSKRGFYHDGRFPTLLAVVDHYDSCFNLGLTAQEKDDLVQYLKSQ
jgi:mono/diheme cytochrome c family protein